MIELDPRDARLALAAEVPPLLRAFNDAGVLAAADVHVARRLCGLGGERDPTVALAAALAVRAPRLGHVLVDLASIAATATVEAEDPVDLSALPWPDPDAWVAAVARSPLVAPEAPGAPDDRPLRLAGARLYLDRYWREERRVAGDLEALAGAPAPPVDEVLLEAGLARVWGTGEAADERQRLAAACAVRRRLTVVAGGPGTGKTTTVARILALLAEQAAAAGGPPPLVALAAPTGKAAARLEEAVHAEAAAMDVPARVRAALLDSSASTLHRLLGRRPGSHSRFRHHRGNRLPHDVVIVDETSMVSLWQIARLLEAVRPDARLVLVGDPGQLASIEAGAVLGDVVGPAVDRPPEAAAAAGVVVLERVHRFGGAIAELAAAIRRGDAAATLRVLEAGGRGVTWLPVDAGTPDGVQALGRVRDDAVAAGRAVVRAAAAGDARTALDALGAFRLLCAHRRGPHGVATWAARVEDWLAAAPGGFAAGDAWHVGRPLLVTENDYGLQLYNGDTGVVVAAPDGGVRAAFERRGGIVALRPGRLGAVETVYAMTVHKSQGSQFATAAVLLPDPASPVLTRELLYTAVTRAREQLILVGTAEAVRAAVERPVARASGLRARLWGEAA